MIEKSGKIKVSAFFPAVLHLRRVIFATLSFTYGGWLLSFFEPNVPILVLTIRSRDSRRLTPDPCLQNSSVQHPQTWNSLEVLDHSFHIVLSDF